MRSPRSCPKVGGHAGCCEGCPPRLRSGRGASGGRREGGSSRQLSASDESNTSVHRFCRIHGMAARVRPFGRTRDPKPTGWNNVPREPGLKCLPDPRFALNLVAGHLSGFVRAAKADEAKVLAPSRSRHMIERWRQGPLPGEFTVTLAAVQIPEPDFDTLYRHLVRHKPHHRNMHLREAK